MKRTVLAVLMFACKTPSLATPDPLTTPDPLATFEHEPPPPQIHALRMRDPVRDELGNTHVTLDAYRHGYRVYGAAVRGHRFADGRVLPPDHRDLSGARFDDTAPSIDEASAVAKATEALHDVGMSIETTRAELRYERLGEAYRLVYAIDVVLARVEPKDLEWRVWIDPQTGAVLKRRNRMHSLVGTGKSYRYGTVPLRTLYVSGKGYVLEDASRALTGTLHTVSTLNADGTLADPEGTDFADADNVFGNHNDMTPAMVFSGVNGPLSATGQTSGVDAHLGVAWAWDLYMHLFSRPGPFENGQGFTTLVHAAGGSSFWSPTTKRLYVTRTSDTCEAQTDIWILAHEMAHGFYGAYVQDTYWGEAGGINEANSDIFGKLTEIFAFNAYANGGTPPAGFPPTWHDWSLIICGGTTRDMREPTAFGQPDAWYYGIQDLDAHQASGPINRFFYFLSEGVAKQGSTVGVQSPYLPKGVAGLGIGVAADLWYHAATLYLRPEDPTFDDLRRAMEFAADSRSLLARHTVDDVFAAVNVGAAADRTPPVVTPGTYRTSPGKPLAVPVSDNHRVNEVHYGTWDEAYSPPWSIVTPATIAGGTYTLNVCAKDWTGNEGCAKVTVIVDAKPPNIAYFHLPNAEQPLSSRPLWLGANDNTGIVRAEVVLKTTPILNALLYEQTWNPSKLQIDVTPTIYIPATLSDGTYTMTATVTDKFDLVSTRDLTLVWDRTKPSICQRDNGPVFTPNAVVTGRGTDALLGIGSVELLLDGVSFYAKAGLATPGGQPYIFAASLPSTTNGHHTLTAVCSDRGGNTLSVPHQIRVSSPPSVSVTSLGLTTTSATFRVLVQDPDGLSSITPTMTCNASGDHWLNFPVSIGQTTYDRTLTMTLVAGESCEVRVSAKDVFQIASPTALLTFTLVQPPPPPPPTCNAMIHSGANVPSTYVIDLGRPSGLVDFDYNTYAVADQLTLSCDGPGTVNNQPYATTFCVGTSGWQSSTMIPFNCPSSRMRVAVTPNCQGTVNTLWDFVLSCGY